mmetsp:Transcript_118665/g.242554  ORF Transcript_118665/g.242554 Transcript_118665/m.242554 type:complete len:268 (-) Transcript_118665:65-868(-)
MVLGHQLREFFPRRCQVPAVGTPAGVKVDKQIIKVLLRPLKAFPVECHGVLAVFVELVDRFRDGFVEEVDVLLVAVPSLEGGSDAVRVEIPFRDVGRDVLVGPQHGNYVDDGPVAPQIGHGDVEIQPQPGFFRLIQGQVLHDGRLQVGPGFPQKQDHHQQEREVGKNRTTGRSFHQIVRDLAVHVDVGLPRTSSTGVHHRGLFCFFVSLFVLLPRLAPVAGCCLLFVACCVGICCSSRDLEMNPAAEKEFVLSDLLLFLGYVLKRCL